jgi:hypothetical protein
MTWSIKSTGPKGFAAAISVGARFKSACGRSSEQCGHFSVDRSLDLAFWHPHNQPIQSVRDAQLAGQTGLAWFGFKGKIQHIFFHAIHCGQFLDPSTVNIDMTG